jgi:hypothetical protein
MTKTNFRKEYPTLTQNINGVEVELTKAEYEATIAQWEINEAEALTIKAEAEAKAQAKAEAEAKLAALGLTTDDLRALGL